MSEFFKGWRWKVGVVMLGIALLFLGAWIRSLSFLDRIDLRWAPDYSATESLLSMDGCLGWIEGFEQTVPFDPGSEARASSKLVMRVPEWVTYNRHGRSQLPADSSCGSPIANWCWRWCRFGICTEDGTLAGGSFCRMRYWLVPYWSIVIPLTLLSAYLLLARPRRKPSPDGDVGS